MTTFDQPKPLELFPGDRVRYFPVHDCPGFCGKVAHRPWRLADGTWVTKLIEMDDDYFDSMGRRVVHGAALKAIEVL